VLFEEDDEFILSALAVESPIDCPNAADVPAEFFQDFAAQVIPVTGGILCGVSGVIAFDCREECFRIVGVSDSQIDTETGTSDIEFDWISFIGAVFGDCGGKILHVIFISGGIDSISPFGVIEEIFEVSGADGRSPVQVDLSGVDTGKDDDLFFCAGDRDIEAPFTALPVDRSEIHGESAGSIRSVSDGKEYDIAFIALHVFQIFNEERFGYGIAEKGFQPGVPAAFFFDEVLDKFFLRLAECDHASRAELTAGIFQVVKDVSDQSFGFFAVGTAGAVIVNAVGDEFEADAEGTGIFCGGEGIEAVAVVVMVAECDQ